MYFLVVNNEFVLFSVKANNCERVNLEKDYIKIILVMKFKILNSDFFPNSNGLDSNQNFILTFEFPFAFGPP